MKADSSLLTRHTNKLPCVIYSSKPMDCGMYMKCKPTLKFEGIIINNALFGTQLSSAEPRVVAGSWGRREGQTHRSSLKSSNWNLSLHPANPRDKLPADKAPLASKTR